MDLSDSFGADSPMSEVQGYVVQDEDEGTDVRTRSVLMCCREPLLSGLNTAMQRISMVDPKKKIKVTRHFNCLTVRPPRRLL